MTDPLSSNPYEPIFTAQRRFSEPGQRAPANSGSTSSRAWSGWLYRARNLVERFFNKIKHCRRVATRYDKLAANFLAFGQLASKRLWLRVNESTT